jgi:hypothetical protein
VATESDVERLVLALPGVTRDGSHYLVGGGLLAWPWLERVDPRRARLENPDVLAVRVPDEAAKLALIAAEPELFFTEPHYDGYAAVLVRLSVISDERLRELLIEGWRSRAPRVLLGRDPG